VDLPGYGYARVPVAVKKKWGPMTETYLSERESLKGVVLIMDIRRTPGLEELNFLDWLNQYHRHSITVLTKTDKLSKTNIIKRQNAISEALQITGENLILFSAKTRKGKDAVWSKISSLVESD
jgi:GTP-binding protein